MKVLVILTYDDYKHGEPPSAVIDLDDKEPNDLYCDWVRVTDQHGWQEKDNEFILNETCDLWQATEVLYMLPDEVCDGEAIPTTKNVKIHDIITGISKKDGKPYKMKVVATETDLSSVLVYDHDSMNLVYTDFSGLKEITEWLRPKKGTDQAYDMLDEYEDEE